MTNPISIFISYAHKDEPYLKELQTFLKPYEGNKLISVWTDKDIVAGQDWNQLIQQQLNNANIILFLISPDFLASDYINDTEIRNAIQKFSSGSIIIIPVIIRPVDLELLQIRYLQIVPTGAKPVSDWDKRDNAWNDVLGALKTVFKQLSEQSEWVDNGVDLKLQNGLKHTIDKTDLTAKLITWSLVLLVAFCIGLFGIGVVKKDLFYCCAALAGIGAGIFGYMIVKKLE